MEIVNPIEIKINTRELEGEPVDLNLAEIQEMVTLQIVVGADRFVELFEFCQKGTLWARKKWFNLWVLVSRREMAFLRLILWKSS